MVYFFLIFAFMSLCVVRQTLVYWNIDDYPIPTDDLVPVFGDILKALHVMGFRNGYIDVYLYSEQINCEAIVTNDFLGQGHNTLSRSPVVVSILNYYI